MAIDGWTLLLQAANFLVLVALLYRFLYRPVLAMMDARQAHVHAAIEEAEAAKRTAEELRNQLSTQEAAIGAERDRLLAQARVNAKAEQDALLEHARAEAERLIKETRESLERERNAAAESIRNHAIDLGVEVAARLLKTIAPATSTQPFLDQAIQSLVSLPAEQRKRFGTELADSVAVRVVSAQPLDKAEQARCAESIHKSIDTGCRIEFADDSSLIAGVEIHFPHTVLRHNWRDALSGISAELIAHDTDIGHA